MAGCSLMQSCNNSESSNQKNISISHDILKGIETGDSTKLSAIPPDAIDHAGPNGDVTSGDSIKAYLLDMHNHIKDLKFDFLGDAASGDYVYTWTNMTGTPTDSLMGFPPNQPVSVKSVDILKIRDGKAVEHWGNVDMGYLVMMKAAQAPNATTVKVTMGDTSANKRDTTKK